MPEIYRLNHCLSSITMTSLDQMLHKNGWHGRTGQTKLNSTTFYVTICYVMSDLLWLSLSTRCGQWAWSTNSHDCALTPQLSYISWESGKFILALEFHWPNRYTSNRQTERHTNKQATVRSWLHVPTPKNYQPLANTCYGLTVGVVSSKHRCKIERVG